MKKKKIEIIIYAFLIIMILTGIVTFVMGSNSEITIFNTYSNKETLKYDDDTIIEFIDIGSNGDFLDDYESKLLINYDSYFDIIKDYTDSPMLDEENFLKNDYIVTYISYFPCSYDSELKLDELDINVHKVTSKYHVDTNCNVCEEHKAIIIIPIKKNTLFRLDSVNSIIETTELECE